MSRADISKSVPGSSLGYFCNFYITLPFFKVSFKTKQQKGNSPVTLLSGQLLLENIPRAGHRVQGIPGEQEVREGFPEEAGPKMC